MTLEQLIRSLNPDMYQRLRRAVELGRWPDGARLTPEQRELCMEAVLHYENLHQVEAQDRVGYLDLTKSSESACNTDLKHDDLGDQPVRWIN